MATLAVATGQEANSRESFEKRDEAAPPTAALAATWEAVRAQPAGGSTVNDDLHPLNIPGLELAVCDNERRLCSSGLTGEPCVTTTVPTCQWRLPSVVLRITIS